MQDKKIRLEFENTSSLLTNKIDNATYVININFSKTSTEKFNDKVERLILNDCENIYKL